MIIFSRNPAKRDPVFFDRLAISYKGEEILKTFRIWATVLAILMLVNVVAPVAFADNTPSAAPTGPAATATPVVVPLAPELQKQAQQELNQEQIQGGGNPPFDFLAIYGPESVWQYQNSYFSVQAMPQVQDVNFPVKVIWTTDATNAAIVTPGMFNQTFSAPIAWAFLGQHTLTVTMCTVEGTRYCLTKTRVVFVQPAWLNLMFVNPSYNCLKGSPCNLKLTLNRARAPWEPRVLVIVGFDDSNIQPIMFWMTNQTITKSFVYQGNRSQVRAYIAYIQYASRYYPYDGTTIYFQ